MVNHSRPQRRPREVELRSQPAVSERETPSHSGTPRQHGSRRDSVRSSALTSTAVQTIEEQADNPTFKRFIAKDGEEYTVFVREDGKLFYVDWEQQKWRVFPSEWCEHGSFESIQSNVR